jgi:long-subunit acyl-CoA synthetase (AMP-forming)
MQKMTRNSFRYFVDRPYLGYRETVQEEVKWITDEEAGELTSAFGGRLLQIGIGHQTSFGVYAPTCLEWVHSCNASALYGFIIASLYDTLGPDSLDFLIAHSGMESKVLGFISQRGFIRQRVRGHFISEHFSVEYSDFLRGKERWIVSHHPEIPRIRL